MSGTVATEERTLPVIAGAALGVVVVSGLLFAGLGALRGAGDEVVAPSPTIAAGDDAASADDGSDPEPGDGGVAAPTPLDSDGDTEGDVATDGAADDVAGDGEATAAPAEPEVDPATVSIQVLDAVGTDGGTAAQSVADELRAAGYDVIVVNAASRVYDVTTVFWTEGEGPGGRSVAATLGTDEARRTPDEVQLSDSVDVHVVVGNDRTG